MSAQVKLRLTLASCLALLLLALTSFELSGGFARV